MNNSERIIGNWKGVEPRLSLQGAMYQFDWNTPANISLQISVEGPSLVSQRFLEMGTLSHNDTISCKILVSEYQLMLRGKLDGQKCTASFIYLLLNDNTLLLSTNGGPMSNPYGKFFFENSYESIEISETECVHFYQKDVPGHHSPATYTVHDSDIYGSYWELLYEAKNTLGLIRQDRIWYFPKQKIFSKPIRYMLKRDGSV